MARGRKPKPKKPLDAEDVLMPKKATQCSEVAKKAPESTSTSAKVVESSTKSVPTTPKKRGRPPKRKCNSQDENVVHSKDSIIVDGAVKAGEVATCPFEEIAGGTLSNKPEGYICTPIIHNQSEAGQTKIEKIEGLLAVQSVASNSKVEDVLVEIKVLSKLPIISADSGLMSIDAAGKEGLGVKDEIPAEMMSMEVTDVMLLGSDEELDEVGIMDDSDDEFDPDNDPDKLWCICKKPHGNRFMICCDTCEEWFHGDCVGITMAMGREMEKTGEEWVCETCRGNQGTKPQKKKEPVEKQVKVEDSAERETEDLPMKSEEAMQQTRKREGRGSTKLSLENAMSTSKTPLSEAVEPFPASAFGIFENPVDLETSSSLLAQPSTSFLAASLSSPPGTSASSTSQGRVQTATKREALSSPQTASAFNVPLSSPATPDKSAKKNLARRSSSFTKPMQGINQPSSAEDGGSAEVPGRQPIKSSSVDGPGTRLVSPLNSLSSSVQPGLKVRTASDESPPAGKVYSLRKNTGRKSYDKSDFLKFDDVFGSDDHSPQAARSRKRHKSCSDLSESGNEAKEDPLEHNDKMKTSLEKLKAKRRESSDRQKADPNGIIKFEHVTTFTHKKDEPRKDDSRLDDLKDRSGKADPGSRKGDFLERKRSLGWDGEEISKSKRERIKEKESKGHSFKGKVRTTPTPKTAPVLTTKNCVRSECGRPAMRSAVYCSRECIYKYAQQSIKLLDDKRNGSIKSPDSKSESSLSSKGTSTIISPATSSTDRVDVSHERIAVFERASGKVIAGVMAPTRKYLFAWLEEHPSYEVLKPGRNPGDLKKEKREQDESVRGNVRRSLKEILVSRCRDIDMAIDIEDLTAIGAEIEAEMLRVFVETGHKYKTKYRSLIFNLKDSNNKILFYRVASREIQAKKLVQMSPEELAAPELAKWRHSQSKHHIEMVEKREKDDAEILSKHPGGIKKTHKGEIEIVGEDEKLETLEIKAEVHPDRRPIASGSEVMDLLKDSTDQHEQHLFDSNCKICVGKVAPPGEQYSQNPSSVIIQAIPESSVPSPTESSYEDDIRDVTSPSSSTSPISPPPPPLHKDKSVWRGFVMMQKVSKFVTTAYRISGECENIVQVLPDTIHICGRIPPAQVWDYLLHLKTSRKHHLKCIDVIRFEMATEEDKAGYIKLYTYFYTRKRVGVVGNCGSGMKDMYIVPLASHDPIPPELLPFNGPGLPACRPHMLVGILVRLKSKKDGKKDGLNESFGPVELSPEPLARKKQAVTDSVKDPREGAVGQRKKSVESIVFMNRAVNNSSSDSGDTPGRISPPGTGVTPSLSEDPSSPTAVDKSNMASLAVLSHLKELTSLPTGDVRKHAELIEKKIAELSSQHQFVEQEQLRLLKEQQEEIWKLQLQVGPNRDPDADMAIIPDPDAVRKVSVAFESVNAGIAGKPSKRDAGDSSLVGNSEPRTDPLSEGDSPAGSSSVATSVIPGILDAPGDVSLSSEVPIAAPNSTVFLSALGGGTSSAPLPIVKNPATKRRISGQLSTRLADEVYDPDNAIVLDMIEDIDVSKAPEFILDLAKQKKVEVKMPELPPIQLPGFPLSVPNAGPSIAVRPAHLSGATGLVVDIPSLPNPLLPAVAAFDHTSVPIPIPPPGMPLPPGFQPPPGMPLPPGVPLPPRPPPRHAVPESIAAYPSSAVKPFPARPVVPPAAPPVQSSPPASSSRPPLLHPSGTSHGRLYDPPVSYPSGPPPSRLGPASTHLSGPPSALVSGPPSTHFPGLVPSQFSSPPPTHLQRIPPHHTGPPPSRMAVPPPTHLSGSSPYQPEPPPGVAKLGTSNSPSQRPQLPPDVERLRGIRVADYSSKSHDVNLEEPRMPASRLQTSMDETLSLRRLSEEKGAVRPFVSGVGDTMEPAFHQSTLRMPYSALGSLDHHSVPPPRGPLLTASDLSTASPVPRYGSPLASYSEPISPPFHTRPPQGAFPVDRSHQPRRGFEEGIAPEQELYEQDTYFQRSPPHARQRRDSWHEDRARADDWEDFTPARQSSRPSGYRNPDVPGREMWQNPSERERNAGMSYEQPFNRAVRLRDDFEENRTVSQDDAPDYESEMVQGGDGAESTIQYDVQDRWDESEPVEDAEHRFRRHDRGGGGASFSSIAHGDPRVPRRLPEGRAGNDGGWSDEYHDGSDSRFSRRHPVPYSNREDPVAADNRDYGFEDNEHMEPERGRFPGRISRGSGFPRRGGGDVHTRPYHPRPFVGPRHRGRARFPVAEPRFRQPLPRWR